MTQLAFDLSQAPAFSPADFIGAACNREALDWVHAWPHWPGFALALAGPAGCGKTHLAHIFASLSGATLLAGNALSLDNLTDYANSHLVIEDADRGIDETALFHLYNLLKENRKFLLLTGRTAPARWDVGLADLRSRLASLPVAMIGSPDDDLLLALLVKLFADRQLWVGSDVTQFLLPRMERSFSAVRSLVERLDAASLRIGRAVTLKLARTVLAE